MTDFDTAQAMENVQAAPTTEELDAFRQWQRDQASPEAKALTEAGAQATTVDVQALLAQMKAMQDRVDSLSALQGIPSDPVAAQVQALQAHVKAQANAHPTKDFSELTTTIDELPDTDALTTDHTELLKSTVEDHMTRFAPIAHDLSYVWQLAGDLHRMLLKKAVKA